jgi:chromate transporter
VTDQSRTLSKPHNISFAEALHVWARIALLSFGGPAGQIAVMHRILVEEKRWIGEERFLHALNFCMLLPGPEAQQLATYIGWLLHKVKGGLAAGLLFILPGFVSIMALSWLYLAFGNVGPVGALFFGLKAAVLAIVFDAVRRIGGRAARSGAMAVIAATAFLAIFVFAVPFPVIVVAAGLVGWLGGRLGLPSFSGAGGHGALGSSVPDADTALGEELPDHARAGAARPLRVAAIFLLLWLVPVAALLAILGPDSVFSEIALFFSQMAVVTFGGAYAVLAYVAQMAVETEGWLSAGEMLDGLGMAETTPGPLIMVTQFVGFLGAAHETQGMNPFFAGTLGAVLTTWVTFTPCFLWIFAGAPFIERVRGNRALSAAMRAITGAVVGVILNLAIWFALHTIFAEVRTVRGPGVALDVPVLASLDPAAALLSVAALIGVFRFKAGPLATIAACGAAGVAWWLLRQAL